MCWLDVSDAASRKMSSWSLRLPYKLPRALSLPWCRKGSELMRVMGHGKWWKQPCWRALCSDRPRLSRLGVRGGWLDTKCTGDELAVLKVTPGRGVRGVWGSCRRPRLGVLELEPSATGLPLAQPLPWMKIVQAIWNDRMMGENMQEERKREANEEMKRHPSI